MKKQFAAMVALGVLESRPTGVRLPRTVVARSPHAALTRARFAHVRAHLARPSRPATT